METHTLITFTPHQETVGQLRAVGNGTSVVIYDDASNPRQAVWEEYTFEEAKDAMEQLDGYLAAYAAFVKSPSKATEDKMASNFFVMRGSLQGAALKIARARNLFPV